MEEVDNSSDREDSDEENEQSFGQTFPIMGRATIVPTQPKPVIPRRETSFRTKYRHDVFQTKPYNLVSTDQFRNILKLPRPDILKLMMTTSAGARYAPDNVLLVKFDDIPKEAPVGELVSSFGFLYAGLGYCRTNPLPSDAKMRENMFAYCPAAGEFSYDGYVLAGSFPVLCCTTQNEVIMNPSDLDFYPYGDNPDEVKSSYSNFLQDMDHYINLSKGNGETELPEFIVSRNVNCTSIQFGKDGPLNMQIIHRGHRSPQSVVVGFDQPACKVFFDGFDIYFTLDAALCLYFGINPVDWRRESPSHMRRVQKYNDYGFSPIFVGLPFSVATEMIDQSIDEATVKEDVGNFDNKREGPDLYYYPPEMKGFYKLPGAVLRLRRIDEYQHKIMATGMDEHILNASMTSASTKEFASRIAPTNASTEFLTTPTTLSHPAGTLMLLGNVENTTGNEIYRNANKKITPEDIRVNRIVDYKYHTWRLKGSSSPFLLKSRTDRWDVFIASLYIIEIDFMVPRPKQNSTTGTSLLGNVFSNSMQLPAVYPGDESDYGSENMAIHAYFYHTLSLLVMKKYDLISVFAKWPTDITHNYKTVNIAKILRTIGASQKSEFYFGSNRYRNLYLECIDLLGTKHRRIQLPLTEGKLELFYAKQREMIEILNRRIEELDTILKQKLDELLNVKFNIANPGAQYSSSFNPIIRANASDYWGPSYVDIELDPCSKQKLVLLMIRKYHNTILSKLDSNVMKIIFMHMNRFWIMDILNDVNSESKNKSIADRIEICARPELNQIFTVQDEYKTGSNTEFKPPVDIDDISYNGYVYPWHLAHLVEEKERLKKADEKRKERTKAKIEASLLISKLSNPAPTLRDNLGLMQTSKLVNPNMFASTLDSSSKLANPAPTLRDNMGLMQTSKLVNPNMFANAQQLTNTNPGENPLAASMQLLKNNPGFLQTAKLVNAEMFNQPHPLTGQMNNNNFIGAPNMHHPMALNPLNVNPVIINNNNNNYVPAEIKTAVDNINTSNPTYVEDQGVINTGDIGTVAGQLQEFDMTLLQILMNSKVNK